MKGTEGLQPLTVGLHVTLWFTELDEGFCDCGASGQCHALPLSVSRFLADNKAEVAKLAEAVAAAEAQAATATDQLATLDGEKSAAVAAAAAAVLATEAVRQDLAAALRREAAALVGTVPGYTSAQCSLTCQ